MKNIKRHSFSPQEFYSEAWNKRDNAEFILWLLDETSQRNAQSVFRFLKPKPVSPLLPVARSQSLSFGGAL